MKIGFRTAGFGEWPLQDALARLADIGYHGVEICLEHRDSRPEDLTLDACEALAQTCSDIGLDIASVSYHADFEPPDQRHDNTLRAVELVPAFGTSVYIINGHRFSQVPESEAARRLHSVLDAILPRAEALGVRVAIEPEPGTAVGSSADMLALIERIGSPSLGCNLDVGHAFLTDEDVCASIDALRGSIFHTHFEGMPAGEHNHLLPGEGDIDLPAIKAGLDRLAYDGYYTVDLFAITDDPARWATDALAGMRQI